jgi:hypothetical protein
LDGYCVILCATPEESVGLQFADEIENGYARGAWIAAKLYPAGAERMERIGMPVSIHGEATDPAVAMKEAAHQPSGGASSESKFHHLADIPNRRMSAIRGKADMCRALPDVR